MKIGNLIRKERNRQGLTAAEVARRAAINPDSLVSAEASAATLRTMQSVLDALRCRLTWKDWPPVQPLGAQIRARRSQIGLSQRTLADRVGVSTRTVIALENNGRGRMSVLDAVFRELRIQPKVVSKNRRAVPTRNAPELDVVYTPRALARDVVEHFQPTGVILEPCKGDGSFLDEFPADADAKWCEIEEGRDFFVFSGQVDWIISNPPWSEFRAFNLHAMGVATNIVWVIPLVHLSGKARIRDVRGAGFGLREIMLVDTPKGWPQGGFQIAAVHLKRGFKGRTLLSGLQPTGSQ
jgi:transcriptional regulator with XRE-family HTH domain